MIDTWLEYDTYCLLWLNGQHHPWLDPPMFWMSETLTWLPLHFFLLYKMWQSLRQYFWRGVLAVVLVISLADGCTSQVMKPYFRRLRPTHEASIQARIHTVAGYRGGRYGFASSHAANTFGLAMLLYLLFRKRWPYAGALFAWAALVSYTRIYLGVHYPLDLLAGAAVGIFFAYLISRVYFWALPKNYPASDFSGD
ncbi:MAG: phosphatase PAP2 family protein [Microscillaceae bacterium]